MARRSVLVGFVHNLSDDNIISFLQDYGVLPPPEVLLFLPRGALLRAKVCIGNGQTHLPLRQLPSATIVGRRNRVSEFEA